MSDKMTPAQTRYEMARQIRRCPCRTEGYSCVRCDAAIDRHDAATIRATLDRDIPDLGLHTRVVIIYEVDQYRATVVHENESILREGVGATPMRALTALSDIRPEAPDGTE